MVYKARARAQSVSYHRDGELVIEGAVQAEGESPLEITAATELGKALAKGQAQGQGIARGMEKASRYIPNPVYKLEE